MIEALALLAAMVALLFGGLVLAALRPEPRQRRAHF
jgi:hypothetical protein